MTFTVEDSVSAGRGTYFPASQFPDAPLPRLRNDRHGTTRDDLTVATVLRWVEAASSQEDVGKVLDHLASHLSITGRWPWLPLLDALQRGSKPYLALEDFFWRTKKIKARGDPEEYGFIVAIAAKLNNLDVVELVFQTMETKKLKRSPLLCNTLLSLFACHYEAGKAV